MNKFKQPQAKPAPDVVKLLHMRKISALLGILFVTKKVIIRLCAGQRHVGDVLVDREFSCA